MSTEEQRAYSRGYAAGLRRKKREGQADAMERKKNAFWQRAFLSALPFAMAATNWKRGEQPIQTIEDRVRLASEVADEAVKKASFRLY